MQQTTTTSDAATASQKPFWRSKTILGTLPILITALAPIFGVEIADGEAREIVNGVAALATLGLVIHGRRAAVAAITLK